MSIGNDFRELAEDCRAIPGEFDLRPHTAVILLTEYGGERTGKGERFPTELELLESGQPPKIRWLNDEELAVGSLPNGVVEIGPITADHGTREYLETIRASMLETGGTRHVVITGPKHPNGAKYRITRVDPEKALHYKIRAEAAEEYAP